MIATIKEIAAEVGVSRQAVSAALNNKTNCRVSPEKREHILRVARENGYRTNFGYKLMQRQKTHTVALVVSMRQKESEEHMQKLVIRLLNCFNELGYSTYFNNAMTTDPKHNLLQIKDLITRGAEHFIFLGSPIGHEEIAEEIVRRNLTYIGFNSSFPRNLTSDSLTASVDILKYFQRQVGDDIRLVIQLDLTQEHIKGRARFQALRQLFPNVGEQELFDRYVVLIPSLQWEEDDFSERMFRIGYEGTARAMQQPRPPRALFYVSDNYALGGAAYLHNHGFQVGRDVLLAGFNNVEAVRHHVLPITSAEHDKEKIIEILLRESRESTPFSQTIPLRVHFRPATDVNSNCEKSHESC